MIPILLKKKSLWEIFCKNLEEKHNKRPKNFESAPCFISLTLWLVQLVIFRAKRCIVHWVFYKLIDWWIYSWLTGISQHIILSIKTFRKASYCQLEIDFSEEKNIMMRRQSVTPSTEKMMKGKSGLGFASALGISLFLLCLSDLFVLPHHTCIQYWPTGDFYCLVF